MSYLKISRQFQINLQIVNQKKIKYDIQFYTNNSQPRKSDNVICLIIELFSCNFGASLVYSNRRDQLERFYNF